jgi:glycosyltransferase involved in cell wall biosynthesis
VSGPLVSVVIPAYNAAKLVGDTVDAVLAQTYPNVEVIVVDDGSKDDTAAALAPYGDRIRVIRKANGGLASARNAGTRTARGEYVAMVDADDLCTPDRVGLQLAFMQEHPEVVLCSSAFSAFDANGRISDDYGPLYYSMIGDAPAGVRSLYPLGERKRLTPAPGTSAELQTYRGPVYDALVRGNFIHPPTVFYRRSTFEGAGDFDVSLRYTSDWEWLVRAAKLGPFGYLDRPLLDYRVSPGQMSGGANSRRAALENLRILERLCEEDRELFARDRATLERYLVSFCLDAAEAHADDHILETLRLVGKSLRYDKVPRAATVKLVAKALTPKRALVGVRELRKRNPY